MSKELTDQWRNGTLPKGWHYMIDCAGKEWFRYLSGVKPDADFVKCFKEVLAPVPSYHDLCELKQELEICKEEKADLYAKLCNALMQLEECKQKVHVLNEANMKLENTVGKFGEQLKEANEVIESLRTYDFTVDDENTERYQVKWNVEARRSYERHGVK